MRPLYISPVGRGGVDFGIQNITRAVRRYGAPRAELLRLPEIYNFLPMLIPRGLPRGWWQGFDLIQGRSRVAFALRAPGRPLVTTVHHLTTDPDLQPYSTLAQRLFYRLVEARYDWWSISSADAVVCVSRYTQQQVSRTYGFTNTTLIYDGIDTDVFVPTPSLKRRDDGLPDGGGRIRLLFVGNRTRRKGFDLLPRILDLLPDEYVLYYTSGFQGADEGPPHPRMVPIGAPDRNRLVAAYQSCDILLAPSRLEGFGIVQAEALACGRPVVTTRISRCRRLSIMNYPAFSARVTMLPPMRRRCAGSARMKRCDGVLAHTDERKSCVHLALSNWGADFWNSMIACFDENSLKTDPISYIVRYLL